MQFRECAVFFDEGRTQVLYAVSGDLHDTARSFVPSGVPFIIMETSALPSRATRDSWVFDYSNPSGYGERAEQPLTQHSLWQ